MAETIDTKLVNFFNSYLFGNVWNEPSKEYRRNIKPVLISKPIANTIIKLDIRRYNLPTAEKYHVYYIPESTMSGFTFRDFPDWITAKAFLDETRVEIRIHNNDGVMLPRDMVYFANHPERPGVLVAVKRSLSRKIHGEAVDYDDIFVAFYYDSDAPNDVTITNYTLDGGTDVNTVYAAAQTASAVYVNGIATQVTELADISVADAIVELIHDENVIGEFEIDLTEADGQRNFVSDLDNEAKTIVHIPKSINPSNKVISHNTCDLWIYPRNGATANRNGRFFHRAIETYSFTQVTHNDFAIPDVIIDTYHDVLNTDEFKLVVQVKNHTKDNTLITDKNFIGLLYTHDDRTILDFLEGAGPVDFDFWKAVTLESSEYVKMITDTPNFIKVENLPEHIGALGYHHSIALISNRVKRITLVEYGGEVSHRFIVPIPIIFESVRIFPSAFLNGERLDQSLVNVNRIQSGSAVIDIDDSVVLEDGDEVVFELFEDIPPNIREVRPSATYSHIDVPNDNFVIYEIDDSVGGVAKGIDEDFNIVYKKVNLIDVGAYVDSVSGRYIAFNSSAYGKSFIIAEKVGFTFTSYDLDNMLENNDPLAFELSRQIKSIDFEPPFVWDDHTGKTSSSGEVYDPNDPDAEIQYPAWHLMDGDETWDVSKRWVVDLRPGGNEAHFDLDPVHQNTYWLIGYRIGAMPNPNDALRASQLPINWQVRVDGAVVDSVTNEWWYLNPEVVHTHMLAEPVMVDSRVTFYMSGVQTDSVFQIQTDMFEPIFSDSAEIVTRPHMGDITCIPYLNGKELVKNIDYYLADIQHSGVTEDHLAARQLVINNAAYLKESGNQLELLVCNNDVNGELQGFLEKPYLGELNDNPRWFDELSMVTTNGEVTRNVSPLFGTVQVPSPDIIDSELAAWFPYEEDHDNIRDGDYTATPTDVSVVIDEDSDGTYTEVPPNERLDVSAGELTPSDFTFSTVFKLLDDNVSNSGSVLEFYAGSFSRYSLVTTGSGALFSNILNGESFANIGNYGIDLHHFAMTVEGGVNVKIYLDGVMVHSHVASESMSMDLIRLQSSGGKGIRFYDTLVFHRALSSAEVVQAAFVSEADNFRLGSPYGTRTMIPPRSEYFIDRYYPYNDSDTLDALTEYFRGGATPEQVVLIPYSHRIVSIRAHIIIRDMILGSLVVPLDPVDEVVLEALQDYDYLKAYDIAYNDASMVDLDYVDVQAMYLDQDIVDAGLLLQINRVIEVLIQDSVTHLRPDHES